MRYLIDGDSPEAQVTFDAIGRRLGELDREHAAARERCLSSLPWLTRLRLRLTSTVWRICRMR